MDFLTAHLVVWLLVLFRLAGIFLLAPVLGSSVIPAVVKVLLAVALSCCVYPMLLSTGGGGVASIMQVLDGGLGLWVLVPVLAGEMMFGWIIGYCAALPLVGLQVGGHVVDQQMGISAGGVFNPDADAQLGTTAQLLYVAGLAIFVMMGGHHVMLSLLVASFETFPLAGVGTGAVSLDIGFVVNLVLGLLEVVFDMALRIAAPMLCIVFLESVAMGFISRTVPQLNIMSVGFVVRILAGLALLVVSIEASLNVFRRTLMPVLEELAQMFGAG